MVSSATGTEWIDLLANPEAIRAIYGRSPSLEVSPLHELRLHRDGPTLTIRFDLAEFPASPPKKWLEAGFNTTQIELTLSGLAQVEIEGFERTSPVRIAIVEDGLIKLSVDGTACRIRAAGIGISLTKISAYVDGAP